MALKDDVIVALGKVLSPEGTPLPVTKTLSDIVAADGKVFFSITVDAAAVKQWESVRERAEQAVRAVPGVKSVMIALTAERAGGAPAPRPQPPPAGARSRPGAAPSAAPGAAHGPRAQAGIPGVAAIIAV